jgi:rhodanese-related sulfurtransferase
MLDKGGVAIIDVRGTDEWSEQRLESSINIPLDDLGAGKGDALLPNDKATPILTVCNVGEKSLYAMLLLKALGYQRVKNLMGGINAWVSEGMPTESG